MSTVPLSSRKRLRNALVLRGEYSGGIDFDCCEIAVNWTKSGTEIWVWSNDTGAERMTVLAAGIDDMALIDELAADESLHATICPKFVSIYGDKPPLGALLALAWSCEDLDRKCAQILARLPSSVLRSLLDKGVDVHAEKSQSLVSEVDQALMDAGLELEDLERAEFNSQRSLSSAMQVLLAHIAEVARQRESEHERQKLRREPFVEELERIYRNYGKIEPARRFPGAGALPPKGLIQLKRYSEAYWQEHGSLPEGKHCIPAGADVWTAKSPEFFVNFDELRKLEALSLESLREADGAGSWKWIWYWKDFAAGRSSIPYGSRQEALDAWFNSRLVY